MRLDRPGDSVEAETGGVEHEDRAGQPFDEPMRDEGQQQRGERDRDVAEVDERDGRHVADDQVADDAAPERRHPGEHEHADDVAVPAHRHVLA